jgi:hypothetical protein
METIQLVKDNLTKRSIVVEDIEAIKAEYLNKDYIIEPVYTNYRINNKGKRFYARLFDDKKIVTAPSFSAIKESVSPVPYGLIDWYVQRGWEYCKWFLEHSANYGTYFHHLCGRILRGDKILTTESFILVDMQTFFTKNDLDFEGCKKWMADTRYNKPKRDLRKDLYGFVRWAQDYKVKPIAIEYPVMDNDGLWAGTIDMVCKLTEPLTAAEIKSEKQPIEITAMVDMKSGINGFYEDHEIQLHAYKHSWNQEQPELFIDKVFNYGCHDFRLPLSNRVTPYKFKDQTDSKHAYKWQYWVGMFHADKSNTIIESKTDFALDQELSLEANLDNIFETVNPLEFLTQEVF